MTRLELQRGGGAGERVRGVLRLTNHAWLTVASSLALSLIGVYAIGVAESGPSGPALSASALKQLAFLGVGMFAALVILVPPYRWLARLSPILFAGSVGLLVFVLLPMVPEWIVKPRNGARSWIDVGPLDAQPSEAAKVAYVLFLAWFMRYRHGHRTLGGLLPLVAIAGVPVALITLQPDLGTASMFIPALGAMLVAAGARLRHLVLIVFLAALCAPAAYPLLRPHQKQRIVGLFKQIEGDQSSALDINFQSLTAQNLAAAGGIAGQDDQRARAQVRFSRLPERHNDMVFSVIVHRFGLVGGLAVIGLYLVWLAGALMSAAATRDPFGRLVIVGLAAFVAAQATLNMSMNLGIAPIVGITLPFVSYGGSSLVTMWAMVGIIVNIAVRRPRPPVRASFEYD